MKKQLFFILALLASFFSGFTQNRSLFHSTNVTHDTVEPEPKTIRVNFSATSSVSVPTYNSVYGSPHSAVIDISLYDTLGIGTGISISSVATGNWNPYSGLSANDDLGGSISGSFFPTANDANVYKSIWFCYGTAQPTRYDITKPQLRLSGLDPNKEYNILMTGMDGGLGFNNFNEYRVAGLTSPTMQAVNGNTSTQTAGASFTLKPKIDGTMDIWVNTSSSGDLGTISALWIIEQ